MRELEGVKKFQKFPGGASLPDPTRSVRLSRRSFRKSVSMYSRSASGTCSSIAWKVGPSDTLLVIFRKSGTVSMNEPMEATGNAVLWIHLRSRSPHRHITRRQHLLPKREGTSKNSRHFASGKHGGGAVIFFYSEDPYLASQRNDRGTTLRFGRHRRPCMQMQLPSIEVWFVRNLWPCTLDEWRRLCFWPTRLVGYFFTLYFFYFVAFQEFTMLQSPNRHVLG